jgi:transmembrane sensor
LFEVAKRPDWPFVVSTGEKEVTALGTTFVVRQNPHQTAVTLLEGKVEVTTHGSGASRPELLQQHASSPSTQSVISADAVILAAGQRVTFEGGEAPKLDKPSLEKVTAWKKGLVELDKTPLIDAVAEMNRYSVVPVVLQEPHEINVRVSGVFRAGDSLEFARAVAQAYGLSFVEQSDAFVLSRSR